MFEVRQFPAKQKNSWQSYYLPAVFSKTKAGLKAAGLKTVLLLHRIFFQQLKAVAVNVDDFEVVVEFEVFAELGHEHVH